ncbi:hypothetical protein [Corynebacterium lowii]|uniref:Uncharacterized protein n=1 Tax=Corynebacterium lowii TaxID=1544413 RepID=A0A0Q0Z9Y3_9CORY|nr:hypothetical protein [Corynebacterium lowii]KQB86551.1 hypothetical protein Clow_00759 [Corynebacterium lowii]MDP9851232.1 hypothetical protein [Corynebacterium lowii]
MTLSLSPLDNSRSASFEAAPPAAIWEPVESLSVSHVRTLTRSIEHPFLGGEHSSPQREKGAGTPTRRSFSDRLTTYLVGGAFGLSIVLGGVFLADDGQEPSTVATQTDPSSTAMLGQPR